MVENSRTILLKYEKFLLRDKSSVKVLKGKTSKLSCIATVNLGEIHFGVSVAFNVFS